MTYNLSKQVVKRMRRYLEDMLEAKADLSWPTQRPDSLAYRIREALAAAQAHQEYAMFHELRVNYEISAKKGWVEARWMGATEMFERTEVYVPQRIVVTEVRDPHGIVGAAIKLEPKANEIYFPNAVLSNRDKLIIYRWTLQEDVRWKFIDQGDEGATLTRKEVDEILLWEPEGIEG